MADNIVMIGLGSCWSSQHIPDSEKGHQAMKTPLEVAQGFVGIKETSYNQGPRIDPLWAYTSNKDGYKDRLPWCATTMCAALHIARESGWNPISKELPDSPAVRDWIPWAKGRKGVVILDTWDEIKSGDIVIYLPHFSHIGIVQYWDTKIIDTIEGNTEEDGNGPANGCYKRKRIRDLAGNYIRFLTED